MSAPSYTDMIQAPTSDTTPDSIERDDILGASTVSQQPLPEYHSVGPRHLKVIREALDDRAEHSKPKGSIYFVPGKPPLVDSIDDLRRHGDYHLSDNPPAGLNQAQYNLLSAYFKAIQQGAWDIVQQLLNSGLVEANTTGVRLENGCTPLMMAVKDKHRKVMILLLENGALVDGWSGLPGSATNSRALRTPLMLAASQGDLPNVKWLMEGYGADDAIVAPDGQLALRLAADAGHEHVVAYLPARTGGIYVRWRNKQAKLLSRIRRILDNAGCFVRAIIYDIPKWLICELIFYPLRTGIKWCWKNKHSFLPFVKRKITELPEKTLRAMRATAAWIRELPTKIGTAAKRTWQALRSWPGEVWRFIKRIPGALKIAGKYVADGVKTIWNAVKHVLDRVFSLIHTTISAIVTFFRDLTLANLITAIADLLEAVFVLFPVRIWHLVENAWETGYKFMEQLFGIAGEILWFLGYGLFRVVIFLPEQLLRVVGALGEMVAASWRELRVWWNPKAI